MTTKTVISPAAPASASQRKAKKTRTAEICKPSGRPLPGVLAWPRSVFNGLTGLARYTYLHLKGQTPPTVNYAQGAAVGFIHYSGKGLTLAQSRKSFRFLVHTLQSKAGLAKPEQKAQWIKYYKFEENNGGSGYWMPFQDQTHKVNDTGKGRKQKAIDTAKLRTEFVSQSHVGEGCDLVVFYMHGGGWVEGHPLLSLGLFRNIMRETHQAYGIKVGFFAVEYSLAPEVPFPGGLEDCLNAYRSLLVHLKDHNLGPKNVVFGGDSAGGNLCYSLALKIRDEWTPDSLPAAIYSSSPYFPWTDKFKPTLFDIVNPVDGDFFIDAYTQRRPEVLASPYYTPFNAHTLAGLPPTLILWGSVEVLAPWIQKFIEQARKDGVQVEAMEKPDRSHCWFMLDPMSTVEDRKEGADTIAKFLGKSYKAL